MEKGPRAGARDHSLHAGKAMKAVERKGLG
jgi:hypothetical protein